MGVSLQKGQKVDLTKGNSGLSKIMIGLGWDPVQMGGKSKGLFGSIFGAKAPDIDCDASVLMLGESGKLERQEHIIYFGNLSSPCGSVRHTGDNLTGDGDGDDEEVMVDINRIPSNVTRLVFIINIYDCLKRNQDFGLIQNSFIRVVNMSNNQELLRYNLSENYAGFTSLIVGEVYRHNNEWKFSAIGEGTKDPSLREIVGRYA